MTPILGLNLLSFLSIENEVNLVNINFFRWWDLLRRINVYIILKIVNVIENLLNSCFINPQVRTSFRTSLFPDYWRYYDWDWLTLIANMFNSWMAIEVGVSNGIAVKLKRTYIYMNFWCVMIEWLILCNGIKSVECCWAIKWINSYMIMYYNVILCKDWLLFYLAILFIVVKMFSKID